MILTKYDYLKYGVYAGASVITIQHMLTKYGPALSSAAYHLFVKLRYERGFSLITLFQRIYQISICCGKGALFRHIYRAHIGPYSGYLTENLDKGVTNYLGPNWSNLSKELVQDLQEEKALLFLSEQLTHHFCNDNRELLWLAGHLHFTANCVNHLVENSNLTTIPYDRRMTTFYCLLTRKWDAGFTNLGCQIKCAFRRRKLLHKLYALANGSFSHNPEMCTLPDRRDILVKLTWIEEDEHDAPLGVMEIEEEANEEKPDEEDEVCEEVFIADEPDAVGAVELEEEECNSPAGVTTPVITEEVITAPMYLCAAYSPGSDVNAISTALEHWLHSFANHAKDGGGGAMQHQDMETTSDKTVQLVGEHEQKEKEEEEEPLVSLPNLAETAESCGGGDKKMYVETPIPGAIAIDNTTSLQRQKEQQQVQREAVLEMMNLKKRLSRQRTVPMNTDSPASPPPCSSSTPSPPPPSPCVTPPPPLYEEVLATYQQQ